MQSIDRGMALQQNLCVKSSMAEDANPPDGMGRGSDSASPVVNGDSRVVSATDKFADFDSGDDDEDGGIFGSPSTEYSGDGESDLDANFTSRDAGHMESPPPRPARGTKPIDIVYPDGKAPGREGLRIRDRGHLQGGDRRGKAWERKRGQVLVEGFVEETQVCDDPRGGTEPIDCEGAGARRQTPKTFSRTKSLTDEDLDELKGCLDLGFGFNYDEIPELCNTLPALELCYSISQKFQDDQQKSPASGGDGGMSDTSSNCSYTQSPIANWKISSPGDRPEQVKARLKYWAQAVACTVRLCS